VATVLNTFQTGNHAGRPTSGLAYGALYACTTHSLIYQTSDGGGTWATWATLGDITGANPQFTTIELGNASDTTIARASAGNLTVEGNALYRAGGTDVPVTDGGTGASTASAAASNLGLGTGDSPQFTAIELGHASDTTISRVSAGVVAIEGTNIVKAGSVTSDGITMTSARLLGRSTASTGAIEEITLGTNLSFSGTTLNATGGAGSITNATADQSADVTLSADTIADATGASISLAAGTWIVFGEMCISVTGSAVYGLMAITDGSNNKVFEARAPVSSAQGPTSYSGHAVVTPGSTTTYKLRGQAGSSGTMKIIKNPEGGSEIGTRITAIQLA